MAREGGGDPGGATVKSAAARVGAVCVCAPAENVLLSTADVRCSGGVAVSTQWDKDSQRAGVWVTTLPASVEYFQQLFVNGERFVPARTPTMVRVRECGGAGRAHSSGRHLVASRVCTYAV